MFDVTATRFFHAVMQTFAPLIDSVVDRVAETRESVVGYQVTHVRCRRLKYQSAHGNAALY